MNKHLGQEFSRKCVKLGKEWPKAVSTFLIPRIQDEVEHKLSHLEQHDHGHTHVQAQRSTQSWQEVVLLQQQRNGFSTPH